MYARPAPAMLHEGPGIRRCCMGVQEVANALEQTLDLPSILPHGARLDPTADGFLIQLPTCKIPHP